MKDLFSWETFNDDISAWDVSKVTDFSKMFEATLSFNQNLSTWNVSSGTNFSRMFYGNKFNIGVSDWNVSDDANIYCMFNYSVMVAPTTGAWSDLVYSC
mmetsp:Transcript_41663/g.50702  ORF Transcript_41663/g.50702 Transcript_41663/m.50702 type:complete len:99 (-) Transcript_41663:7-303(-)